VAPARQNNIAAARRLARGGEKHRRISNSAAHSAAAHQKRQLGIGGETRRRISKRRGIIAHNGAASGRQAWRIGNGVINGGA
jgi:hypothetical protein